MGTLEVLETLGRDCWSATYLSRGRGRPPLHRPQLRQPDARRLTSRASRSSFASTARSGARGLVPPEAIESGREGVRWIHRPARGLALSRSEFGAGEAVRFLRDVVRLARRAARRRPVRDRARRRAPVRRLRAGGRCGPACSPRPTCWIPEGGLHVLRLAEADSRVDLCRARRRLPERPRPDPDRAGRSGRGTSCSGSAQQLRAADPDERPALAEVAARLAGGGGPGPAGDRLARPAGPPLRRPRAGGARGGDAGRSGGSRPAAAGPALAPRRAGRPRRGGEDAARSTHLAERAHRQGIRVLVAIARAGDRRPLGPLHDLLREVGADRRRGAGSGPRGAGGARPGGGAAPPDRGRGARAPRGAARPAGAARGRGHRSAAGGRARGAVLSRPGGGARGAGGDPARAPRHAAPGRRSGSAVAGEPDDRRAARGGLRRAGAAAAARSRHRWPICWRRWASARERSSERILALSAGNPALRRGRWRAPSTRARRVARRASLAEAFRRRLRRLAAGERRVLEAATILGGPAPLALLAALVPAARPRRARRERAPAGRAGASCARLPGPSFDFANRDAAGLGPRPDPRPDAHRSSIAWPGRRSRPARRVPTPASWRIITSWAGSRTRFLAFGRKAANELETVHANERALELYAKLLALVPAAQTGLQGRAARADRAAARSGRRLRRRRRRPTASCSSCRTSRAGAGSTGRRSARPTATTRTTTPRPQAFDRGLLTLGAGEDLAVADLLTEKAVIMARLGDTATARGLAEMAGNLAAGLPESREVAAVRNRRRRHLPPPRRLRPRWSATSRPRCGSASGSARSTSPRSASTTSRSTSPSAARSPGRSSCARRATRSRRSSATSRRPPTPR